MTGPNETPLRAGDEVKLELAEHPGVVTVGPIKTDEQGCCLMLGPFVIVQNNHRVLPEDATLTVTKPAPRPFYANHEREEPVQGDVCRDADTPERRTYLYDGTRWITSDGAHDIILLKDDPSPSGHIHLPENRLLLVDGDTGLTVAPLPS